MVDPSIGEGRRRVGASGISVCVRAEVHHKITGADTGFLKAWFG